MEFYMIKVMTIILALFALIFIMFSFNYTDKFNISNILEYGNSQKITMIIEEEEEEEDKITTNSNYKQARIKLRQKLLSAYILKSLDSSLKKSVKFKGKRAAGSEYIQNLIKQYENETP